MNRRHFLQHLTLAATCSMVSPSNAEERSRRIVDTHTHFYDPTRAAGVPWPGKGTPLYRTVMPEHWLAVASPMGVRETVVVEASSWLEDNQWLLDIAQENKSIVGIVGHLSPQSLDFPDHVKRFAKASLFRGIRVGGDLGSLADDSQFRKGLSLMVDNGWELDINGPAKIHPAIAQLANRFPQLRIVVNHVGLAGDASKLSEPWLSGIANMANCPNVFCKVSALGEQTEASRLRYGDSPRSTDYYRPLLDHCWKHFGPDRLIYGSNWSVCEKGGSYSDQFKIVEQYFQEKGSEAAEKYFWRNAQKAYGFS